MNEQRHSTNRSQPQSPHQHIKMETNDSDSSVSLTSSESGKKTESLSNKIDVKNYYVYRKTVTNLAPDSPYFDNKNQSPINIAELAGDSDNS